MLESFRLIFWREDVHHTAIDTSCDNKKQKKMGLRKQQQLACLSLLLLIILIFKTPTFAVGYGRFNKFRTGFSSPSSSEVNNHGKQQQKNGHKSIFFSIFTIRPYFYFLLNFTSNLLQQKRKRNELNTLNNLSGSMPETTEEIGVNRFEKIAGEFEGQIEKKKP